MKRDIVLFLIIASAAFFLSGCAERKPVGEIECSGRLKTRKIELDGSFLGIKAEDGIKVIVSEDTKELTVRCDKRVQRYVIATIDRKVLNIRYAHITINGDPQTEVIVPMTPDLYYIYGMAGATIDVLPTMTAKEITFRATADAVINADVSTHDCIVDINKGAVLNISGKTYKCKIDAASGAVFNGENLDAKIFSAQSIGGATINR